MAMSTIVKVPTSLWEQCLVKLGSDDEIPAKQYKNGIARWGLCVG